MSTLPQTTNDWRNSQRSQDVQEVIGTPPNWLARYGTSILLVIILLLVGVASIYTYPAVVEGDLMLTTIDPPRLLKARQGFSIQRLLVADRDSVEAGQTLIVADNGRARFEHVLYLEDQLIEARGKDADGLQDMEIPGTLILGNIQESVYEFQDKQEVYRNLAARRLDGYTTRELDAMIRRRESEIRQLRTRQSQLEENLINDRIRLNREEQLARDGLENPEQLSLARRRVENAEEELQRSISTLRSASFDIELMNNQIDSYRSGRQGSSAQAAIQLREAFESLQTAVANWKRDFTIVSPVNGTVVLAPDVREDHFIVEQELMATVLPFNAGSIVGRIQLAVRGSGKVDVGQRVLVRFPKWPYLEYGSVEGRIVKKGLIPVEQEITIEVDFPDGLVTTTGHPIEPVPFMQGQASIITEQKRLLARFLDIF